MPWLIPLPTRAPERVKLPHGEAPTSTAILHPPPQRGHRVKSLLPIAALLLQAGTFPSLSNAPAPLADPQHLRYVRALTLPPNTSGIACTVLDASVYSHTASPSADDLRVFRAVPHTKPQEVPFVVSYSEAQPSDAQTATVHNLTLHDNTLTFALDMPPRPYTAVDLNLAAHNFLATAEVSDAFHHPLGTFSLFDLTARHLARSTTLALQETTLPQLHITLHPRTPDGKPFPDLTPTIVQGATVPASREAQTLYTVVASTDTLIPQPTSSVAEFTVPAHLPIERVQFLLDPAYKSDFYRNVTVTAAPTTPDPASLQPEESITDHIWRVTRPAATTAAAAAPGIRAAQLAFPAVIASNLHDRATVRVAISNPPLPLRAVQLAMRQRTLCFRADPNATYTLRYGDNDLHAPVYTLDDLTTLPAHPIPATLEPEILNSDYIPRPAGTPTPRNPNLFWIALLATVAVSGSLFSRHAARQGSRR
jgi:hypothetical protein